MGRDLEARELLLAHGRGEHRAGERIARRLPRARRCSVDEVLALPLTQAEAELVVAREAGFATWARLTADRPHACDQSVPLHEAVRAGDLAAVQQLLGGIHLVSWQTREAIEEAILRDDRAIVRALLAHGGWVDSAGRTYGRWGGGLHAALLLARDAAMIDELIAGGASVSARDRDGRTPLAIAVRTHHVAAQASLRKAGAREDEVDDLDRALGACVAGAEPPRGAWRLRRSDHQHLAWAIRRGRLAALPALLGLGLDPNVSDDDGATPLHLAASAGSLEATDGILAAGVRVDARDYDADTALAIAVRSGAVAIADRLRRGGAILDEAVDDAELFEEAADAAVAGEIDRLRSLLDRAPALVTARSLRPHRATLLHYLGANGVEMHRQRSPSNAPAIASLLLARGADPNALALTYGGGPAQTTLYLAATSNWPEDAGVMTPLLEALIAGGAVAPDEDRATVQGFRPSTLPVLVHAGLTVDLWLAAALGRVDDVRRLVGKDGHLGPGAKVGSEATTPDYVVLDRALHAACSAGHAAIVTILLDAGARIDARDVEGMTGLHQAARNDHLEVARVLLARGAPRGARNVYGGDVLGTLRWAIANQPRERPNAEALIALLDA